MSRLLFRTSWLSTYPFYWGIMYVLCILLPILQHVCSTVRAIILTCSVIRSNAWVRFLCVLLS